jgi:uncharacterized protein YutE (UPF0331/DUF86 family)
MDVDTPVRERLILDRLRESFEHQGYEFFPQPLPDMLPTFLRGYHPDAIALKDDDRVIIEIKGARQAGQDSHLEKLANLVSGQPGWRLQVYFGNERSEEALRIAPPDPAQITEELTKAERLAALGHRKAAMLLAWSIFEAVVRARVAHEGEAAQRPFSPAQAIQSLEMAGLIGSEVARNLQAKAKLRNLIAHGDLSADVESNDLKEFIRLVRSLSSGSEAEVAQ